MPGAVIKLPFDATGFAPSTRKKSVRSTSGTGSRSWCPNISSDASMWGSWSTEVAEYRLRERSTLAKSWPKSRAP